MKENHRLALEAAVRGEVSGSLKEWPVLAEAFSSLGWKVPDNIRKSAMKGLAKAALANEKEKKGEEK